LEITLRPWGMYEILLDSSLCKVKRITVEPSQSLSYQFHYKRSEVWTIISGIATITLDDKREEFYPGDVIKIPAEMKHRIENKTDKEVIFIEVQHGTYFGEDDIVRLNDRYGRV